MDTKTNSSHALIPTALEEFGNTNLQNLLALILGITLLAVLAQVSITLPWTPVPITGQTFGVTLIALGWGSRRGVSILLTYVFLGAMGLPIFAQGKSHLVIGPTSGYLLGMIVSSGGVGWLADRQYTLTYRGALIAGFIGSVIVYSFGLFGLSFYIPAKQLLTAGFFPFIPGDIVKTTSAVSIVFTLRKKAFRQ